MRKRRTPIPRLVPQNCSVETLTGTIPYVLRLSPRRRTISISINAKAVVNVYAPRYVSRKVINAFISDKAEWIQKQVHKARHVRTVLDAKKYQDGEEFLFLGNKYPLRVVEKDVKRGTLDFDGRQWRAVIGCGLSQEARHDLLEKKMIQWYREQAKELVGGRVFYFSRMIGIEPLRIEVRTQKRIWGNCDPRTKTIHINWQVILSPLPVIDYIVVHELCHLRVPNHSRRFWQKVENILPDYKAQKQWLKTHAREMLLPGQLG